MRFKHIVSVGCSYIRRSFEEEPWRDTQGASNSWEDSTNFTEILGKKYNIPTYNLAIEGASPKYIAYRLYRWLRDNPEKIKDTFFIIGVTNRGRDTFWFNENTVRDLEPRQDGGLPATRLPVYRRVRASSRLGCGACTQLGRCRAWRAVSGADLWPGKHLFSAIHGGA